MCVCVCRVCDYGVFVLLLLLEGSGGARRDGGGVGGHFLGVHPLYNGVPCTV